VSIDLTRNQTQKLRSDIVWQKTKVKNVSLI